jgi:16S rRNA (guanine527-N7)-methyltransferase
MITEIDSHKDICLKNISKFHNLNFLQKQNLESFVNFLLQENNKYNFIGKSTIDNIWDRHVLDSAQLIKYISNKKSKFADLGSGAGFPGIILSIMGIENINLIEKSFRKADFLKRSKNFSSNKIFVSQKKIEELDENIKFDCILSRALAPLPKLLEYSKKIINTDGYCLFLKGRNLTIELDDAKKIHKFDYELFSSITSSDSSIIKISNIH